MHQTTSAPIDLPCACTTLRKAARAVSRIYDDSMGQSRLTTTQLAILRSLGRTGDQPLSRVAEAMVMDRTSLYRAIRPLIAAGWLTVFDAAKGRAKIAALTPAGRQVMDEAAAHWEAAQTRFVSAFGAETWMALHTILMDVIDTAAPDHSKIRGSA